MKQLFFLPASALYLVAVGFLSVTHAGETGRWKLGVQGCYFDQNDSGPDQCSPNSGRYKYNNGTCYWDANDSGPDQCTPGQPPLLTDPQDQVIADAVDEIASLGLTGVPADINAVVAVLKAHGFHNMNSVTCCQGSPFVFQPMPPPPDDAFWLWHWAVDGGTPRCNDKDFAVSGMRAVDYLLRAGGAALSYLSVKVQNMQPSIERGVLLTKLQGVTFVHDALITVSGDMLELAQNRPCLDAWGGRTRPAHARDRSGDCQ